jgi:hypothetical protein
LNASQLPLAVTCTALYLGLGLLPFAPAGIGWSEALGLLPGQLAADGTPFVSLLLALPLGYLWQGVVWPHAASRRLATATATAVFLGLGLLAILLLLGQIYYSPRLAVPGGLLVPVLGFAAGMVLWWLLGPALNRRQTSLPRVLWPALVIFSVLSVLVPLDLVVPLSASAPPGSLSSFVSDIPQRFYLLVKSAILWVPLGFILTLAGWGELVPRWGVALPVALLLMGWPYLGEMPLREALELVFALPGLWLGAWLGERTRLTGKGTEPAAMVSAAAVNAGTSSRRKSSAVSAPPAIDKDYGNALRRTPDAAMATHSADALPPKTEHAARRRAKYTPLGIALGLGLLILAVIGLFDFSRWQVVLAVILAFYAGALWFQPLAWLVVVPATLPLLDLAPWTGRFFFDEFDLLMLVTAGVLFLRGRRGRSPPMPGLAGLLVILLLFSSLVSVLIGVFPLVPFDMNAMSSYWSPYNGLRLAKGVIWGGLFYFWVKRAGLERHQLARWLSLGMGLGLLGVGLVGIWERSLFVGAEGGNETYRIVSTFSSMHTGGGHIEAYLVAALPFLWLGTTRLRDLALTGPLLVLTAFVLVYTVARGGVLALAVVLFILLLASVRTANREGMRRILAPIGMLVLVGGLVAVGAGGGYFQKRFETSSQDWQIRVDHWGQALAMRDEGIVTSLFGMGLGSFPRTYQERGPLDKQPASFGFASEHGNTYFRQGSGETIYYAQRIPFSAGMNYRLEMDIRGRQGNASIDTPVCEKQMLNSRQCEWFGFSVPGDGQWHRVSKTFSSTKVGAQDWFQRPPVELFLYNTGQGGIVDVDNIRLVDANGRDVLCNGDFSQGGDCWFFKTHSHLPWHIKNVWVHVLFEQGWVGLMLFAALIALAIYRLIRAGWRGHRLAWAWLASLVGLLTVGMFDSLLDAPRIAMLLVALLLLGAGWRWSDRRPPGRSSSFGKTKPTGHQQDQGQYGPEDGDGLGQADDVQDADAGPPVEVRQP